MGSGVAVVSALAAAGCFAVSTSLQHRSAEAAPSGVTTSRRLVAHLARRPMWLLGMATGAVGFLLHALAVHRGALVVVQPLVVSGFVLALPVRAALDRRVPTARLIAWAVATAAGIATFVIVAQPTTEETAPDRRTAGALLAAGVLVGALASRTGRRLGLSRAAAVVHGGAAGMLFGLGAGLLKLSVATLTERGVAALVLDWAPWALLVVSLWALALNQSAYQAAPLSVSMPVLNVVNPAVAVLFGIVVFAERPAHDPVSVLVELASLGVMALGARRLARAESIPARPGSPGWLP